MKRPIRTHLSPVNLSRRGVPKKFHNLTIDDFDDFEKQDLVKVKEVVKNYIENLDEVFEQNLGLLLYGSNGVGKTFLASLIVKEAYRHRYTSKRCTFVEYINEYTKVWNAKSVQEKEELEELFYHNYKAVEFLALEEIGKELDTKLSPTILEDLLRYREDKGLPTIICTNLTPKTIVERYGQSIGSLIKGNFTPIKIVGADVRQDYYKERVGIDERK
ncbi:MAG: AAA family ATPase [Thermosipho sp. (in: Bacteria)]|nr:AAA family ATPase [Thermosipho sp. (in: thermotogales)]